MDVKLPLGTYVVAVSGGVDSMVLLHALARAKANSQELVASSRYQLVVAHFEHGVRPDSEEDLRLVQSVAAQYGLPFIYEHGHLGANVSEAAARKARYAFLHKVREEQGARAIVTAHHQDDVLETAIINMLRGTGRKGLSALRSSRHIVRPLLDVPKSQLLAYAKQHKLAWHEDSTNSNDAYLRNYIRHHIVPRLQGQGRQQLLRHIATAQTLNAEIDTLLAGLLAGDTANRLDRAWFITLPYAVAVEVLAAWLRANKVGDFNRQQLARLTAYAKTALPGKQFDVLRGVSMYVEKAYLRLV